ncbi:MAG: response regulator transcription factor [Bacteroidota bacterium]
MKILIIEDNDGLLDNMVAYLEREGYIIETAQTEEVGLDKIYDHRYDIVLLDIMLSDGKGLDILTMKEPIRSILIYFPMPTSPIN